MITRDGLCLYAPRAEAKSVISITFLLCYFLGLLVYLLVQLQKLTEIID